METETKTSSELPEAEVITVMREDGSLAEHPDLSRFLQNVHSGQGKQQLSEMYYAMVYAREVDLEATRLQRQGALHMWVPSIGQEAAQVGAVHALGESDYIFPTYREHSMAFHRGVKPEQLMSIFRGNAHAGWDPAVSNFHIYTLVLAAQTLHAVGLAMAYSKDREANKQLKARSVMACFGDGASSEGDVHESMVFAASYNAPVIFFCQNNGWAISVPVSVQSKVPLANRALGYGFPGIRIDGNDILASFAATAWANERAKEGLGPTLIEAVTYRMGAHTTADDPTKYRSSDEEQSWASKDPITRLRTFLLIGGHANEAELSELETKAQEAASTIRAGLEQQVPAQLAENFKHVYGVEHGQVSAEYQEFLEYSHAVLGRENPDTASAATAAAKGPGVQR